MSEDARLFATLADNEAAKHMSRRWIEVCTFPSGERRHQSSTIGTDPRPRTRLKISLDNHWLAELYPNLSMQLAPVMPHIIGSVNGWHVVLGNLDSGECHMDIHGDTSVEGWDFSPDGHYLAISQPDGNVIVWDVEQQQRLFE